MKRFVLSAVAVAAFGIAGTAQADLIDSVGNTISRIFGVPYDPTPPGGLPVGSIYTDAYGRQFQVDAAGRHIPLNPYGSYPQYGQVVPYGSVPGTYAVAPTYDLDGDGVADAYDRSPQDPRWR